MKTAAFAIALLMSGAAFAAPYVDDANANDANANAEMAVETPAPATTALTSPMPASGQVAQPSNAAPERDARGIAVISDPAMVPAGFNGTTGTAVGGPLVDPATGATLSDNASYPACSKTVTDNCVQAYERGRKS